MGVSLQIYGGQFLRCPGFGPVLRLGPYPPYVIRRYGIGPLSPLIAIDPELIGFFESLADESPLPLFLYNMPSPNFVDFDGDGLPDLIFGEFLDKFTFFKNLGTRTEPEYAPGKHLRYNGEVITMDLEMIQPSALDWDMDGNVDLIVGDEDGRVALVKNTGRIVDEVPEFEPPVYFQQKAESLNTIGMATNNQKEVNVKKETGLKRSSKKRLIGRTPKVGIRPVIDGRRRGVRESLEEQTMNMAQTAAAFISDNLQTRKWIAG